MTDEPKSPGWYVARTHVHAENKASANLKRQGYEVYLPMGRRWRTHARKREIVNRPLFPGYIFVGFDVAATRWRTIYSTLGVASLITANEQPLRVPDGVIESIRAAEQEGAFDYMHAVSKLKPGDTVRIATGPFADLIGQLQSHVSKDRVRVLLNILGRQSATELSLAELESI